jgi:anaerobic magnesium-protoporphyrin IX monomethyl ester cyclase
MRKLRILIIVPKFSTKYVPYEFPIGLAYISAIIKKELQFEKIDILNTNHFIKSQGEVIKNKLSENQYDVILTGGMSAHWTLIDEIIKSIKKFSPKSIIIIGGPIIVSDIDLAMKKLDCTFSITEEGEYTIIELLNKISSYSSNINVLNDINNFSYIEGINYLVSGQVKKNIKRSQVEPLDDIPFPDYEGFGYDEFLAAYQNYKANPYFSNIDNPRLGAVIASRSCPYSCTFCFHPLGKKYRQRSLDNLFEEIDYLVEKYEINVLSIMDELFSVDKNRMLEFSDRIKDYNLKWIAQFRVTDVDAITLQRMKDSGLYIISYGIESLDDSVLDSMKKGIKRKQIEHALELTRKAKIGIQGNVILGDLAENRETYNNSIKYLKENPKYNINLSIVLTIPDSEIYQYAIKNELIVDKLKHIRLGFPYVNITKMSDKEYEAMVKIVWDINKSNKIDGEIYFKYGEIIKVEKCESYYNAHIKCPECKSINIYKIKDDLVIETNIYCKECMFRFKLNKYIFYPFMKKMQLKLMRILKYILRKLNENKLININLLNKFNNFKR